MKKIVIASDSFKGSVTSMEVAQEAELAILEIFPECEIIKIPIADGGEGTVETLVSFMNGSIVCCPVNGPLEETIEGKYGILGDGKTAIIEMASVSGLALLSADKRNPMRTTTFGTGQLIKDALLRGYRDFIIGIGGSATNDAGTGMLQALGFHFLDSKGNKLGKGGQILEHIITIDDSDILPELKEANFKVACDVKNPFSGSNGAAHVYARQKGADDEMIISLDKGLRNFAKIISEKFQIDMNTVAGSGAAGGLGGGFVVFLQAELTSGIRMILNAIGFDELIKGAELIITGEGKLDEQTKMGKAPCGILEAGLKQNIPVIAIGGDVKNVEELNKRGFLAVLPILPFPATTEQAMEKEFTRSNIRRTLEQQLRVIKKYGYEQLHT